MRGMFPRKGKQDVTFPVNPIKVLIRLKIKEDLLGRGLICAPCENQQYDKREDIPAHCWQAFSYQRSAASQIQPSSPHRRAHGYAGPRKALGRRKIKSEELITKARNLESTKKGLLFSKTYHFRAFTCPMLCVLSLPR